MQKDLPPKLGSETLRHLATEQLVEIIIEQAIAIEQLKSRIQFFEQAIKAMVNPDVQALSLIPQI